MSYAKDQLNENILVETVQLEKKYDIVSVIEQRDALLVEIAKLNVIIEEAEKLNVKLERN